MKILKKSTKKKIAYITLLLSTTLLVFNNVGQTFTLINIPFSRESQILVALISMTLCSIWYLYLEGVLK